MIRNILFVFIGLLIALSLLVFRVTTQKHLTNTSQNIVKVGDINIKLRIARTPSELETGLGHVSGMPENEGMLFVMNKFAYHSFWMKGMEFPLDFIWISGNKSGNKIVDITQNVPISTDSDPPIIQPQKVCNYVLEVNAGFIKRHHVRVGQPIILRTE